MADDQLNNAGPTRLNASAGKSGWRGPLMPYLKEPEATPLDGDFAEQEERLAAARAETERLTELVFAARDHLAHAGENGGRAAAEADLADARRAREAASVAEGRARVRLTALGIARSDWKREQELRGTAR